MLITSIIAWIVLGAIAGALGRFLLPGNQPMSMGMTILLGIVGAVLGGFLARVIGIGDPNPDTFNLMSILTAAIGAMIVLFVYLKVVRKA